MPESQALGRVYRTTDGLDDPEVAQITGTIPDWIQGSFLRTGPGVFDLKNDFCLNHIFDGYAVLSKFEFHGNRKITFDKKIFQSEAYQRACNAGKPCVTEYGTRAYSDPNKGFFAKWIPNLVPPLSDNCNMAIYKIGNEFFASSETCYFRQIDPSRLECGEKFDTAKLYGLNAMSCHPLTDETGHTYNIGMSMATGLKYNVVKIPPPASNQTAKDLLKKAKIICSIPSSWNGYMSFNHSFAMTKNYIIIIEQPYCYNAARVLGGILTKTLSIMDWLSWKPNFKNTFFVVEKESGRLVKTEFESADPFFYLHIINAYEEEGHILLDLSIFPDSSCLEGMTVQNMRNAAFKEEVQPYAVRFCLPMLSTSEVTEGFNLISGIKTEALAIRKGLKIILTPETITEQGLEMPVINRKYLGRKYSYYYATGSATNGVYKNSIVKVDLGEKRTTIWQGTRSQFVGEPVFVANPKSVAEDDGVLLSCVTTAGTVEGEKDFLLVLDARSLKELGRAHVNSHVSQGVHGLFIPTNDK